MSKGTHGIPCPHCGSGMQTYMSRLLAPTLRESRARCRNLDCGATYCVMVEITHQVAASRMHNALVSLRSTPPRPRMANDLSPGVPPVMPLPANDVTAGSGLIAVIIDAGRTTG